MLYFFLRYDMIAVEMFGSDIIRVKINGYLRNNTEKDIYDFNIKGIKNKNKISYSCDNVMYNICIEKDNIILKREGNDFINTFIFNKKNSISNYLLKDNNYDVDIDVITKDINVSDNSVYIKYLIVDSNSEFEFKLEMSDV